MKLPALSPSIISDAVPSVTFTVLIISSPIVPSLEETFIITEPLIGLLSMSFREMDTFNPSSALTELFALISNTV